MRKCIAPIYIGMMLLFAIPISGTPILMKKEIPRDAKKPGILREYDLKGEVAGLAPIYSTFSPGDTLGSSRYDRQWNLAPHRRIVCNPSDGYIHTLFMHQVPPPERHMFYNCNDGTGWLFGTGLGGGIPVQEEVRDGYGTLDIKNDGAAVVALHRKYGAGASEFRSSVWIDAIPGMGTFDGYDLPFSPSHPTGHSIWPRIAVDGSNNMIVVAKDDSTPGQPHTRDKCYYSRSTDGGATWSNWVVVDTFGGLSDNAFASKSSQKMCIVYGKDVGPEHGVYNGHIFYKESQDGGATWGDRVDITNLIPLPPGRAYHLDELRSSIGNTYGIYDSDDNLHIVTDASLGTPQPGYYYPFLAGVLWHYSVETNAMSLISTHPLPSEVAIADFGHLYPYYGPWNAKPQIGEDPTTKYLYATWVEFPYNVTNPQGYEVGEIYASYSLDRGVTWAPKINLTMTPQNCEVFAALAPVVNSNLHIFYEWDLNSHDDIIGGSLDPNQNPFIYFRVPVTSGDAEVVSIDEPIGYPQGGVTYTPKATYRNNGTNPISLQARFEVLVPAMTTFPNNDPPDTLIVPYIFYYSIVNVADLAPGATQQVQFDNWTCDPDIIGYEIDYYASASFLADNNLANNRLTVIAGIEETTHKTDSHVFAIFLVYPNPMNKVVTAHYSVPTASAGLVTLKVYDISGKLIATLVDGIQRPGNYTVTWNGQDSNKREVANGIYFLKLTCHSERSEESITKKLTVLH
ncbi:MAG: FlgD immunoglobulin-like domain containing protein [bacterium]|nr:FlgD immunoglobulin-like domain containing protein [bacterium]